MSSLYNFVVRIDPNLDPRPQTVGVHATPIVKQLV